MGYGSKIVAVAFGLSITGASIGKAAVQIFVPASHHSHLIRQVYHASYSAESDVVCNMRS
jgi:hypothetical protein